MFSIPNKSIPNCTSTDKTIAHNAVPKETYINVCHFGIFIEIAMIATICDPNSIGPSNAAPTNPYFSNVFVTRFVDFVLFRLFNHSLICEANTTASNSVTIFTNMPTINDMTGFAPVSIAIGTANDASIQGILASNMRAK